MLIITIGPDRVLDEPDELGNTRIGYREGMSDRELYDVARGSWVLGEKADGEHYALIVHDDEVRLAIDIDRLVDTAPGRRAIEGQILVSGDPVFDEFVGRPSPVESGRNPIRYADSPIDRKPCRCGCGEPISTGRSFVQGHDQAALHDRIKQIGTVAEFIDWFDALAGPIKKSSASADD